jgi:meiotically up-regulated gene 157 (Mug157) protein
MRRRSFLLNSSLLLAGATIAPYALAETIMPPSNPTAPFPSRRPPLAKRRFTSPAIEAKITDVTATVKDPEIAWLFANCFPNTLDTTVTVAELDGKPDTYVITGDINAMWLRDSAAQVWPYLALMKQDPALERMIEGVVNRQARCVRLDPYANAFYRDGTKISYWKSDKTEMRPGVHERKWEIDSLCYVIRLAHGYWRAGGAPSSFDAEWLAAMRLIVQTFKEQQRKTDSGPYSFVRNGDSPVDTAAGTGQGNLAKPNGLICSVFRPSDDGTIFPYLIPSNFFAVVSLRQLAELVTAHFKEPAFAAECTALADEVHAALRAHATVNHPLFGEILAYEIDGFGGRYLADDANVPSLLSLPYLDALAPGDMALYQRTRKFLLSPEGNPYYAAGTAAEGVTGPHVGRDMIWPMGIILRALTSNDDAEIARSIHFLKTTHAGTGFMHEAFHKDDATRFTRKWFAWANTLYGEFILHVLATRPHLLTAT